VVPTLTTGRLHHSGADGGLRSRNRGRVAEDGIEVGSLGGSCDNPPKKIPYYRLNQSTLVVKQ
jgi:hypothetical protein